MVEGGRAVCLFTAASIQMETEWMQKTFGLISVSPEKDEPRPTSSAALLNLHFLYTLLMSCSSASSQ